MTDIPAWAMEIANAIINEPWDGVSTADDDIYRVARALVKAKEKGIEEERARQKKLDEEWDL